MRGSEFDRARTDFCERCMAAMQEPKRFQAKWVPVRVKKTRQNKRLTRDEFRLKRPTVFFRVILRCAHLRASKDEKRPWPILRGSLRSHLRMTPVQFKIISIYSRLIAVTSLPAALMRAMASVVDSITVAI